MPVPAKYQNTIHTYLQRLLGVPRRHNVMISALERRER